jgi:cell division septation protein DedD
MEELLRLGPMQLTVRALQGGVSGVRGPFVALLPAMDLKRLGETTSLVPALVEGGCVDIILAGPRADAFQQQIGLVLKKRGKMAASSPYPDLNDACNAALLGALVHHSGLALCLDAPELLDTLRTASQANGWTADAPAPAPKKKPTLPAIPVVKAKPVAKPAPKAKPRPKAKTKPKLKARR